MMMMMMMMIIDKFSVAQRLQTSHKKTPTSYSCCIVNRHDSNHSDSESIQLKEALFRSFYKGSFTKHLAY
jgi:hypothetical protein